MNFLAKIKEIEAEAQEWTANDGGLTAAACDLLDQCSRAKELFISGDKAEMERWAGDPFSCSTGLESDLVSVCLDWARHSI